MNIYQSLPRPFFVLAPMDDVTDTVFRQIISSCANPDLYFTEFVNVDGLQSPGRHKLLPKLRFSSNEQPLIAQIWGKKPENYYQTAKDLVEMGYQGIDINMGCPDKAIIKNGCCAAFINNRDLAKEVIEATKEGAQGKVPISVKTRLGFNEIDLSWHDFLLRQQLQVLTIHGRTKKQMSNVPADWKVIRDIRVLRDEIAPDTLIVGNGDVVSIEQGTQLAKDYQLDGIMIGRGVFSNPFIFSKDSEWDTWSINQKKALYRRHIELFISTWKNNERKLHTLNRFCKIYINGFEGAKELREQLMAQQSAADLLKLLA
ncbi:MAG: tRNA-dihydrouridine synthase [Candidatus Saccharimonadales bacterium]